MDGAGGDPSSGNTGGSFDPCECINMFHMTQEHAMNRLTNILRNAQTTCTDTECFASTLPGQQTTNSDATEISSMYLIIVLWLALAFLLFILRPRMLRDNRDYQSKPNSQDPRHNNQDPPEPELQ